MKCINSIRSLAGIFLTSVLLQVAGTLYGQAKPPISSPFDETDYEQADLTLHPDTALIPDLPAMAVEIPPSQLWSAPFCQNGRLLILEDMMEPRLIVRLSQLPETSIHVQLSSASQQVLFETVSQSLFVGNEFHLDHQQWPEGRYKLSIELGTGEAVEKTIIKAGGLAILIE